MNMLKENSGKLLIVFIIIFIPVICYIGKFYSLPFSDKTQDWANFATYLGGIYSSAFGLASTVILCLTLYFTIQNNITQSRANNAQIQQLKKESTINTFINHIQALNEKFEKRVNTLHILQQYMNKPKIFTEDKYLDKLREEYNKEFSKMRNNLPPRTIPSPFDVAFEVLTNLRVRYPQEIASLLNILSMINTCEDLVLKEELICLFHSLTYRDRTYWILMYALHVNEEAKITIINNSALIAKADGLS